MTPKLTPQEIEAIKKEAESILKITYIHHTTEVNPDDNWADWETCKKDGTVEMVLEAMTKQVTSERLKHEAEIQAYRAGLNKIIDLYPNTESKAIIALNDMRQTAFDTLNQFKEKMIC